MTYSNRKITLTLAGLCLLCTILNGQALTGKYFEDLDQLRKSQPLAMKAKLDSIAGFISPSDSIYHQYMHSLAKCYLALGNYDEALQVTFTGEEVLNGKVDPHQVIYYKNRGAAYYYLRKRDKAIRIFQKGISYSKKHHLKGAFIGEIYNNLGAMYAETSKLDSSRYYLKQAIQSEEHTYAKEPSKRSSLPYRLLGTTYYIEKNYPEARKKLKTAYKVALNTNDPVQIVGALIFYGDVLLEMDEIDSALYYYNWGKKLSLDSDVPDLKLEVAKHQVQGYERAGMQDSALVASQLVQGYQLELYASEMAAKVSEMEVKYQTAQLKQENLLKEAQIQNEKTRTQQYILLAVIALMVLILAVFIFLYLYNKKKDEITQARQNAIIRLQDERLRISKDLHDNIGAQITVITSTLDQLEWGLSKTNNATGKHLKNLSDYSRQTMTDLRETVWAMKQDQILASDLCLRIQTFIQKIADLHPALKVYMQCSGSDELIWEPRASLNLMRIVQEAIQNSLKHSEGNELDITIDLSTTTWHVSVKDNGKGFNTSADFLGNGLLHMKDRAVSSGFNLSIQSDKNKGTKIMLTKAA